MNDRPRLIAPMLVCADAAQESAFCQTAFGAVELSRRTGADGRVIHATLAFFDSLFMVHNDAPQLGSRPPAPDGSSPVVHFIYCGDVDGTIARALAAGATLLMPAEDQFWGDRVGRIIDPAHHVWNIAARITESNEGTSKLPA